MVSRDTTDCFLLSSADDWWTGGWWDERASGWSAAPAARARVRAGRLGESTVSVPNAMMRHAPL